MILTDMTDFKNPIFKEDWMYKIHLMGYQILEMKDSIVEAIDIFLYTHDLYIKIKTTKALNCEHPFILNYEIFDDPTLLRFPGYVTVQKDMTEPPTLEKFTYYITDKKNNVINVYHENFENWLNSFLSKKDLKKCDFNNCLVTDCFAVLQEEDNKISGTYISNDLISKIGTNLDMIQTYFPDNKFIKNKAKTNDEYQINFFLVDLDRFNITH